MVIPDTLQDPRFADNPQVTDDLHIRFYAGKPLLTTEGTTLGTLCIMDTQPRVMTTAEIAALAALGGWAEREIMLSEWQQALAELDNIQRMLKENEDRYRSVLSRVLGPSKPELNSVSVKTLPQPAIAPALVSSSNGITKPIPIPLLEDQTTNLPILLVEDNDTNLRLTLLQLKRLGYEADTACTGQQAVDAVAARDYMLVLMDCMMPEMDGLEATRIIRQAETTTGKHVPIIALTANAIEKEDRIACLAAGMDDYLAKPIDLDQLNAVIKRWNKENISDKGTLQATHVPTTAQGSTDTTPSDDNGVSAATLRAWTIDSKTFAKLRKLLIQTDPGFLAKSIDHYLENSAKMLADLRGSIERSDVTETHRLAHTLKSSSANYGATLMSSLCRNLEALARSGSLEGAMMQVTQIEAEYENVKVALIAERNRG
jgi:CheY-like chemotaxis protein